MTTPEADQPSTSGRPLSDSASSWSPSTPPAQEWHSHWQSVLPELEELARSASSFYWKVFSKVEGLSPYCYALGDANARQMQQSCVQAN